jgi:hypothetical protein
MGLEFGIGFGQDESVHDIGEHCRHAEELGFTHATMVDLGTIS